MNTKELMKLLKRAGVTFDTQQGKSSHIIAHLHGKRTTVPQQGSRKELGTGLVNKILKDLDLK